ncbi:MAG: hypothetical protein QM638_01230 [Nocardioides sp.]|uniref:hypothetical protein n=1 Tax=Nocardioides sp. TaxID=35761 RepID=UPI0039E29C8F
MTTLFTADDLTSWLHKPVTEADATVAERVVWGWLKPILKLDERPDPVPDELFGWAIELGGIAHENPGGFTTNTSGPFSVQFDAARRTAILEEVAQSVGAGKPTGSFPPPQRFPDPALPDLPDRFGCW